MSISAIAIIVILYLMVLFVVARHGDRFQFVNQHWTRHPLVYCLALGVYCTSWTFYGLVGTAASSGWAFLPVLLGPFLLFTIGHQLLKRMLVLCEQENVRSIADFMSSRYGKRPGIAAVTTLIILAATVPYIALQLKAVSDTVLIIAATDQFSSTSVARFTALAMILFSIVFGVKRLESPGYHSGLMSAMAFESLVKLFAIMVLAFLALMVIRSADVAQFQVAQASFQLSDLGLRFVVETLVSAAAVLCLPRMFHITFVERVSERHLNAAKFIFPLYLFLIGGCIYIAAIAGNVAFQGMPISGDTYVLQLPIAKGQSAVAMLVFIGGFSAATAMIIMATVTLSYMLSNDVILPLLLRGKKAASQSIGHYSNALSTARYLTVVLVVVMALIYQEALAESAALTDIGLIAFALAVQLAPALLLGVYSLRGNATATYAGLTVGCLLWFVTLMLPLLARAGALPMTVLEQGLFGLAWLRPEFLFGLSFSDSFTRGVLISLSLNVLCYWVFALASEPKLADRVQAKAFTSRAKAAPFPTYEALHVSDLRVLLSQFLGSANTEQLIARHAADLQGNWANPELCSDAEHALAGVAGVASARTMLSTLASGDRFGVEDVVNLFEGTAKALRFNQDMIFASFESISSGISVVNDDLNMVAWNRRYEEIFNYPEGVLRAGISVAELVRFNARRGLMGEGDVEQHVQKRLGNLRTGKPYRVIRQHSDVVIEIKGRPLPQGGYVTTYDDITEFIQTQTKLEQANTYLENRVAERTREAEAARKEAEQANRSKSKFLALATHDLLQPVNAASLYASILHESARRNEGVNAETVDRLTESIGTTEAIISTLLEISKLDTGSLNINLEPVALGPLMKSLLREYQFQVNEQVELHLVDSQLHVLSDPLHLRRILQNFVSNAVKYTLKGKILMGCRRRGNQVEIQVLDTGPGISDKDLQSIFIDFYRGERQPVAPGLGLGLAVTARFSQLLNHEIKSASQLGRGSSFSILVPVCEAPTEGANAGSAQASISLMDASDKLAGKSVFFVDDDLQNIHAIGALLEGWQCRQTASTSFAAALDQAHLSPRAVPDIVLLDYQLDRNQDGITLANCLHEIWGRTVPTCIISASGDIDLPDLVAQAGFEFLRKPLKPGKLRAVFEQLLNRQ